VVGPTPDPARSQNSVRSFLKHEDLLSGLQEQVVNISKVPYRDW
jgi:hypothetical protein